MCHPLIVSTLATRECAHKHETQNTQKHWLCHKKQRIYVIITVMGDGTKTIRHISGQNSHGPAQAPWQVYMFPWQSTPSSQHFTLNSEKDEELTFVATGNWSQAKEEEGEKIHSVHLREERKGRGVTRRGGGRRVGGDIQYMHQQQVQDRETNRSGLSDGAQRLFFFTLLCKT